MADSRADQGKETPAEGSVLSDFEKWKSENEDRVKKTKAEWYKKNKLAQQARMGRPRLALLQNSSLVAKIASLNGMTRECWYPALWNLGRAV